MTETETQFILYTRIMTRVFLTKIWAPWLAGLLLLTFFTYAASFNNAFVRFDDNVLIYQNPAITHLSFQNLWFIFTHFDPELYIPLTFLTYQMIHTVAGLEPAAYHMASLLLHCINALLVASVIWSLTKKRSVALIVAALFALHPLHSEVVLWAAAMKDVLSTALGLLSLALYIRFRDTGDRRFWIWCSVTFALGLLAKVSIVLFPLLFVLVDYMQEKPLDRKAIITKWPLYLLSIVFIIIALAGKSTALGGISAITMLLLSFKASAFYVLKLVWPMDLSILYPQTTAVSLQDPLIIASIFIVIALLITAFFARSRARMITGGILWYFLLLLPSFSTFNKNGYLYFASARYAYLPSIGLFLIVALAAYVLWQRWRVSRIPLAILGVIITIIFVFLTHQQVDVWQNSKSLFGNVIARQPGAVIAYNNYANDITDPAEAIMYFRKAIALDPEFLLAYRNIAALHAKVHDTVKQQAIYQEALPILSAKKNPSEDDIALLFEYAELLDEQGNRALMFEQLQKAIALDPSFAAAQYNLGVKFEKYGMLDQAAPALERARELGGDTPDTLYHLASVYAQTGKLPQAAELLERLVRINPRYEKAAEHLANIKKLLGE